MVLNSPSTDIGLLRPLQKDMKGEGVMAKLCSLWPNVQRPDDTGHWMAVRKQRAEVLRDWSRVAGVPEFEIKFLWAMMFANGYITVDGKVDPLVRAMVNEETVDELPKLMRAAVNDRRAEQAKKAAGSAP